MSQERRTFKFPRAIRVICIEGNGAELVLGKEYWMTGVTIASDGFTFANIRGAGPGWSFLRFEQASPKGVK